MTYTLEKQQRLLQVLVAPVVTEKSMGSAQAQNKIVFKVAVDATKKEVLEAIEFVFNRRVAYVNILNRKGKEKRFRNRLGRRDLRKIAYITLEPNQELIDLEAEVK